jgi:murein hydrolase activator
MRRRTVRRDVAVSPLCRSCLSTLLCLLLCGGLSVRAQASDTEKKLESIQSSIQSVTKQLESAQGRRGKLEAGLRNAEQAIARAANNLHDTQDKLASQRKRLDRLDRKAAKQQDALQTQVDALRAQIGSAYRMGRQPAIKLFLNQENPALLGRMLAYFDYLNHARQNVMASARKELSGLIATRQQADAERLKLQKTLTEQRARQAALKRAEQTRREALAKLDKVIGAKRNRLQDLKANEHRLRKLLSSVGQAVVNDSALNALSQKPFSQLRGRLPWPTNGTLRVRFNSPRSGSNGSLRWQGVFIGAPKGQSVRAIDAGRVVFANWLRGYGLLLIIDHGHGFMSLYGHNQAIYRRVGTWVRPGEIVASIGDSGGQNTDGLYFAIRHDGKALNPARWCRGKPRRTGK